MKQILTALSVLLLFSALKMAPKETPGSTPYSRRKIPPPPAKPCVPAVKLSLYYKGKLVVSVKSTGGFNIPSADRPTSTAMWNVYGKGYKADSVVFDPVNQ